MDLHWRKSSFSDEHEGSNCLELASRDGEILVRESDSPAVVVKATQEGVRAFLAYADYAF
ncbi:DUF397 domain-containing protein [Streptomyces piniterrae]|uniref:DUF397 domain-containing protein n=1 Tax=Streptomyces piniterrae TaxID=2571125 RepID=A0A4U0MYP2_9ACTN|nr:DUF397 domain-containing protein [Streptomyces piniterrae]TJZ42324.1 DUF397 domain-containing protein [Streptomyces piniterrae]